MFYEKGTEPILFGSIVAQADWTGKRAGDLGGKRTSRVEGRRADAEGARLITFAADLVQLLEERQQFAEDFQARDVFVTDIFALLFSHAQEYARSWPSAQVQLYCVLYLDTQGTAQGVESLRQALPNCSISLESQP